MSFTNQQGDKPCFICGKIVTQSEESTWDRSPAKRGKAHITCMAEERIAQRNGTTTITTNGGTERVQTTSGTSGSWLEGMAEQLMPFIEGKLAGKTDKVEVEEIVKAMLEGRTQSVTVTIKDPVKGTEESIGVQHKQFSELMDICQVRHEDDQTHLNILLTGPAGTGKTRVAFEVAKALKLPFYFTGAINTEYKLLGFIDAQGRVINPAFRKAYTGGGVFLFDEVWRSLPPALMPFNAALAGSLCDFPDGTFERHPDFICIAADNKYGMGGDSKYIGHKHDASVLDRFVTFQWDIDEALEEHIAKHPAWCARVRHLRANAERKGLDVLITPRASRDGASMLRQGIPQARVEQMLIKCKMTEEQWRNIQ